jgi:signal transduction histidine kinase
VEIDASEILRGVVDVFRRKLASRKVSATVEADAAAFLYGVPGELRQVFSNLLSNAIDASPAGSQVRIRIKQAGDRVQIAIADRGSGIPEVAQAQIFEPFFTTKKDVGTGLGLWISREIIQNHGGRIHFRSRTGAEKSGTVFVVYLSKSQGARSTAA